MSTITGPLTVWLNTHGSQFTPIGQSTLIPFEIEILKDWVSATIDFNITSPETRISSHSIKIDPIVLKKQNHVQDIIKTNIKMEVNEEGFYEIEAKISLTLSNLEPLTGTDQLSIKTSFGVFSFQGKYIYSFSSKDAIDKYAEINVFNNPKLNQAKTVDSDLADEQIEDIIFEERLRIEALYENKYPSILGKKQPPVLNLKKEERVEIKVNWPINEKRSSFLPLHNANIEIKGDNGKKFKGVLNNGKFTFIVPEDNFTFEATVIAKYSDKFALYNMDESKNKNAISTKFNNQLEYDIDDETAPYWSVFEAVANLTDITEKWLNFSRKKNRSVYVSTKLKNSYYLSSNDAIYIAQVHFYNWDIIAHEYGHAIANETNSIAFISPGIHTGDNQYDVNKNQKTYENKRMSLALAFNEAYGHWIGTSLLKYSDYANEIPYVGDNSVSFPMYNVEFDLTNHYILTGAYGEDSELSLAVLFWHLMWHPSEGDRTENKRAKCNYKVENISYRLKTMYNQIFKGQKFENISDFYKKLFLDYVGVSTAKFLNSLVPNVNINKEKLQKIHNLAMPFAEFGIAPNINDTVDQKYYYKLAWSQLKTGGLPGHDEFDIYFFSNDLKILVHKIKNKKVGLTKKTVKQNGTNYTYTLQKDDLICLDEFLTKKNEKERTLYVMIAATATGYTAKVGKVATGPYFSNLAEFKFEGIKKTVIAVDSSGSNKSTDPENERIVLAHKKLNEQAEINDKIFDGLSNEKAIQTVAMDFDEDVKILADFTWPNKLFDRKIFNSVDSSGNTDIAAAIYASINLLKKHDSMGNPIPTPHTDKNTLYLQTDMDNNHGWEPVQKALNEAEKENIKVIIGHLNPSGLRLLTSKINDDIVNNTRARVPFDDIIEAILKTGGSYAEIKDAASQQAWSELVNYLDRYDPTTITEIPLPLNICFYHIASAGRNTPTYFITASTSGEMTIMVDGKNSFVPNLKVNGVGKQTEIGSDYYEIKFDAIAGQTYAITLNKPIESQGLYSIIAQLGKVKKNILICEGNLTTTGAALTTNGDVYVWGYRGSAQQGNGVSVIEAKQPPQKVSALSNIVQLVGGAYHLLALDMQGDVWGWGQNTYGEVGNVETNVATPQKVLSQVMQISSGEYFSLALDSSGQVWTWGNNAYGQLGNGNCINSNKPIMINLNHEKVRVIGGAYESAFAVTEEGHVWAWGNNETSGLGFENINYCQQKIVSTPVHVANLDKYADKIIYIAGGKGWGEALLNDGTVIGWGLKTALGIGDSNGKHSCSEPIVILTGVQQLFARYNGSFALTNDGKLYTWGRKSKSSLAMLYGRKVTLHSEINSVITRIGGGKEHLFYETDQGKIYGVGYNDLYKLDQKVSGAPNINWPGKEILLS